MDKRRTLIMENDSTPSRQVNSNQAGLHPRLASTVARHLQSEFRRPVATHCREAYNSLKDRLQGGRPPLVLDSFCGTGQSTALLAERHPDCLVVGIDQSQHRLGKHVPIVADNYLLLRAQAEDIWQLLLEDDYHPARHYLLYPNPWPKGKHLQRRVHGHPGFAWLLALGGTIEVRSNWQTYVEEFGVAMHLAGRHGCISRLPSAPPLTLFEQKYQQSGHALWRYRHRPAVTNQGL